MKRMRDAIQNECFDKFVVGFVRNYYKKDDDGNCKEEEEAENKIPNWVIEALAAVNIKFD